MLRERYPTRPKNYEHRCRRVELPDDVRKGKRHASGPVGGPSVAVAIAPSRRTLGGVSVQANEACEECAGVDGHVRKGACWRRLGRDAI